MQIYVLLLPFHLLFLIMFSSPIVLGSLFMGLYLLDMDSLYIPKDQASQQKSSLVDSLFGLAGKDQFKIFIFSLLLSTLLGFTRVDVRSSYNLLVANLNTLLVQLIFVVHQWLSQHCEPIHWSQVALITKDKFSEHKTLHPDQMPLNSFITRLNLADPQDMVLIECKFELVFWHFLTSPGQLSLFITTVLLQLMCPEFSRLSFICHIIDEQSPLCALDIETLKTQDASLTITVSAVECSSQQPVFSEHLYAVGDGDILWDC
ncbi:unnamed protein product [Sphagnum troendelagicum]|uniref:Uncharacterized protein n=1 Tax=Sphagnum troendelagicum TaxID=128251 RepID=A0ABP0TMD1_9BRYO